MGTRGTEQGEQKRDPGIAQVAETSSAPPRPTGTEDDGTPGREAGSRLLPDEGGLPSGVLPHEEHHRLVVEVGILQSRRVELVELVVLFQWEQLGFVELFQALANRLKHLGVLPPAVVGAQPAEHLGAA